MKHIGLFEGIGGFSLAAHCMEWETVAWCELDEFCQKILKYYFPKAKAHGDIKKTDFTGYAGQIDILTGGFPCQPYSNAGKRLGKEDDRHLWPEMLRAIREIQPRWVVGENVRGLTNWNGGLVFDEVQADLENEGYEVTPYLLPACAVNAPHRRDRIWFVAYNTNSRVESVRQGRENAVHGFESTANANKEPGTTEFERNGAQRECEGQKVWTEHCAGGEVASHSKEAGSRALRFGSEAAHSVNGVNGSNGNAPNANQVGQSRQGRPIGQMRTEAGRNWKASWSYDDGRWPTQSPICSRNDGIPAKLDGISFSKWREKSIGAYGNAIVPQLALQIFKAISAFDNKNQSVSANSDVI